MTSRQGSGEGASKGAYSQCLAGDIRATLPSKSPISASQWLTHQTERRFPPRRWTQDSIVPIATAQECLNSADGILVPSLPPPSLRKICTLQLSEAISFRASRFTPSCQVPPPVTLSLFLTPQPQPGCDSRNPDTGAPLMGHGGASSCPSPQPCVYGTMDAL